MTAIENCGVIKTDQEQKAYVLSYPMFLFLTGSVGGWLLEIVFRSACEGSLYIPGYLLGPYCPIYGFGTLIITYLCNRKNKFLAYLEISIFSTILEYAVSWFFEAAFDMLLWDYSFLPFHIGTRVCIAFSFTWGVLGLLILIVVVPRLHHFYLRYQQQMQVVTWVGMFLILIDTLLSVLSSI